MGACDSGDMITIDAGGDHLHPAEVIVRLVAHRLRGTVHPDVTVTVNDVGAPDFVARLAALGTLYKAALAQCADHWTVARHVGSTGAAVAVFTVPIAEGERLMGSRPFADTLPTWEDVAGVASSVAIVVRDGRARWLLHSWARLLTDADRAMALRLTQTGPIGWMSSRN